MVKKHIRSGDSFYSLLLLRVEKFASIRIRAIVPGLGTQPEDHLSRSVHGFPLSHQEHNEMIF